MKNKLIIALLAAVSCLFVSSATVHAAILFFETATPSQEAATEFSVMLKLDSQGEAINALGATIVLPSSMQLISVQDGNTLVGVWVDRPQLTKNGLVSFSGIIPGGYTGSRSAYWVGTRPGEVLTLKLKSYLVGNQTINLRDGHVFLNGDQGVEAKLITKSITVHLVSESPLFPSPKEALDTTPPELPQPVVTKLEDIEPRTLFLIFQGTDKGSGIDHYEVGELRSFQEPNLADIGFTEAVSPYKLTDQANKSYIYVKAIDRSGNVQIAMVPPPALLQFYEILPRGVILIGVLAIAGLFLWLWKRRIHS